MVVIKVVDEAVADKVDTQFVKSHLPDVPNTGIVFICTSEGGDDDDWTDDNCLHTIVI